MSLGFFKKTNKSNFLSSSSKGAAHKSASPFFYNIQRYFALSGLWGVCGGWQSGPGAYTARLLSFRHATRALDGWGWAIDSVGLRRTAMRSFDPSGLKENQRAKIKNESAWANELPILPATLGQKLFFRNILAVCQPQ